MTLMNLKKHASVNVQPHWNGLIFNYVITSQIVAVKLVTYSILYLATTAYI